MAKICKYIYISDRSYEDMVLTVAGSSRTKLLGKNPILPLHLPFHQPVSSLEMTNIMSPLRMVISIGSSAV